MCIYIYIYITYNIWQGPDGRAPAGARGRAESPSPTLRELIVKQTRRGGEAAKRFLATLELF